MCCRNALALLPWYPHALAHWAGVRAVVSPCACAACALAVTAATTPMLYRLAGRWRACRLCVWCAMGTTIAHGAQPVQKVFAAHGGSPTAQARRQPYSA